MFKNKDYLPFIVVFILCIAVIVVAHNFITIGIPIGGKATPLADVDDSRKDWFINKQGERVRPEFPDYVDEYIDKLNIYTLGEDEKELYLTFNCGYEYQNYTMEILDILKEEKIVSAFFITGGYLRSNPQIVQRMVAEGHIVGNHGNTHKDLSKCSVEEIKREILDFEESFLAITGRDLDSYDKKYFRPASGVFTGQALVIAKELNYTSVFWSMAYKDWERDNQPGKETAYLRLTSDVHNGCILMLHTVSKSNVEALKDAIIQLKSEGYGFRSLDEFE